MLKAYAVALVLSTATPVATNAGQSVQAPETTKAPVTTTQAFRPSSVRI
ncbi:MAG: hypothetical protein ACJA13_000021 [Paraglaciecola sp.]|jgi:hypothetical protein